ncbi:CDK5RAP1-like protein [Camellia lanceoleosa]|uniref:CDK5RAP1-like protein n=1 Tax=Camellia lanceoleosa TaxID=1840588 RepID=A0ACC0IUD4_9ERIC|nr:CDK5RAP1-like protein [Camellia lanceoleosa]
MDYPELECTNVIKLRILTVTPTPVSETLSKGCIYHETYGCQMNINDMEIVLYIMKKVGYKDVVERQRERSRPVESIDVNSSNDASGTQIDVEPGANWKFSEGFSITCKVKKMGLRFVDLLDQLARCFCGETKEEHEDTLSLIKALVLVEGPNKRASEIEFIGRTDRDHRLSFANLPFPNRDNDYNGKQNPGLETMYRSSDVKFNKSIAIWISPCYN